MKDVLSQKSRKIIQSANLIKKLAPAADAVIDKDPNPLIIFINRKSGGQTELIDLNVRVSLFMDADVSAMAAVKALGAHRIELYTEPYAAHFGTSLEVATLARYADTAKAAQSLGLGVNAGHDLNLANLPTFIRAVPDVLEVSIGHALIGDALEYGLADTVRRYRAALRH